MANVLSTPPAKPPAQPGGPTTVESFIADRQTFWSGFTNATTFAVVVMVVLLIGMAIFLV